MRKELLVASCLVLMSVTAFADGWHRSGVETRWGRHVDLGVPADLAPCRATIAWAQVHDYGVRFTIMAWGCNPGHVLSVWALIGPDSFDLSTPTVNCGGGIVFPNGRFKTICDVPIGNLDDMIDQCKGIPEPDFVFFGGGCAQMFNATDFPQGAFREEDLHIDILTHDDLDPAISMAQIRTTSTCSFWSLPPPDGFGPGMAYAREDSCIPVRLSFPARKRH